MYIYSNEKKEVEMVLTNKFKEHRNRKPTRQIDVKSTRKIALELACSVDEAHTNTCDAECLGLKKLG